MRKLLLALFVSASAIGSNLMAQDVEQSQSDAACDAIGVFAKSAMRARQGGVPLQTLMANNREIENASTRDLLRTILLEAYAAPVISSASTRQIIITEFQNLWYLECIKGSQ